MDKKDAELLNIALIQINRQLKAVFEFVKEKDPENLEDFKHKFARVLGNHILDLQTPLWEEFPDLKPEYIDGTFVIDKSVYNKSPFGDKYTLPEEER